MPEQTVYEDQKDREQIPICQKCFDNAASTTCRECGCPLCIKCVKKHICNLKDKVNGEKRKKEKVVN